MTYIAGTRPAVEADHSAGGHVLYVRAGRDQLLTQRPTANTRHLCAICAKSRKKLGKLG